LWQAGIEQFDELCEIDWDWLAMDGAMSKAPLGGEKTGPNPTDRGKSGVKPQGMCLAKGYDYDEVRDILREFGFTAHIRGRGEEARVLKKEAGFKARRWVVERTHSWMNRLRRLLVRWDKKPENYLAFLHFACGLIAFRAAGLFG
jgi:transposase